MLKILNKKVYFILFAIHLHVCTLVKWIIDQELLPEGMIWNLWGAEEYCPKAKANSEIHVANLKARKKNGVINVQLWYCTTNASHRDFVMSVTKY